MEIENSFENTSENIKLNIDSSNNYMYFLHTDEFNGTACSQSNTDELWEQNVIKNRKQSYIIGLL